MGTWLQAAAVRWLVFEQTHSEFMLGVVEVASLMPGLFVGLFAGALADRVVPLRMIVLMECGQMAPGLRPGPWSGSTSSRSGRWR